MKKTIMFFGKTYDELKLALLWLRSRYAYVRIYRHVHMGAFAGHFIVGKPLIK